MIMVWCCSTGTLKCPAPESSAKLTEWELHACCGLGQLACHYWTLNLQAKSCMPLSAPVTMFAYVTLLSCRKQHGRSGGVAVGKEEAGASVPVAVHCPMLMSQYLRAWKNLFTNSESVPSMILNSFLVPAAVCSQSHCS